ncbi:DUF1835 domain-containing protein [Bacillus sp. 3255]|uniref:DUF1835 domain-containing protein n=1 Tax=Bacillus sp. 3255 TaxID=2817904 RepID=UPI00285926F0|nr:DUF1835 domain-containing protein [Bacillus sp. 3255]MDR6883418.1 hypothetical protein [Bacillus sp. 3255]
MPKYVHIVNGDAFGNKLRATGLDGVILVWRESLYEGPVGMQMSDRVLLSNRASYMYRKHGIPEGEFKSISLEQERQLDRFAEDADEIVFWFDHDLFDQLMLCYLFMRLRSARRSHGLSLIMYDASAECDWVERYEARSKVTEGQLRLGGQVWRAYSAPEPLAMASLLKDDLSVLPYLKKALEANIGRYPSVTNGLSRLQQLILSELEHGERSVLSLFQHISAKCGEYGLGDLQFWSLLEHLRTCKHPLIAITGGDCLPKYNDPLPEGFSEWRVSWTEMGKLVFTGSEDQVLRNGIDDWIGGVHLRGSSSVWRWDAGNGGFLRG